MRCPLCGQEHPESAVFCPVTGQKINQAKVCPHCGQEVEPDWQHCGYCGQPLQEAPKPTNQQTPQSTKTPPAPSKLPGQTRTRNHSRLVPWLVISLGAIFVLFILTPSLLKKPQVSPPPTATQTLMVVETNPPTFTLESSPTQYLPTDTPGSPALVQESPVPSLPGIKLVSHQMTGSSRLELFLEFSLNPGDTLPGSQISSFLNDGFLELTLPDGSPKKYSDTPHSPTVSEATTDVWLPEGIGIRGSLVASAGTLPIDGLTFENDFASPGGPQIRIALEKLTGISTNGVNQIYWHSGSLSTDIIKFKWDGKQIVTTPTTITMTPSTSTAGASSDLRHFSDPNYAISFDYPVTWITYSKQDALSAKALAADNMIIGVTRPGTNYNLRMAITVETGGPDSYSDDQYHNYARALDQASPGGMAKFNKISENIITIGGVRALEYIFQYDPQLGMGLDQIRQISVVWKGKAFTLSCGAPVSDFDSVNKNVFDLIIKTFKFE